jgi:hypothetical protein
VAIALLPVLGRPVSPATVSAVARQLDAAVAAFHQRPLKDIYRVLVLDGVVLRRKSGAGALARPVRVALGLRPDGNKEVIDCARAGTRCAAETVSERAFNVAVGIGAGVIAVGPRPVDRPNAGSERFGLVKRAHSKSLLGKAHHTALPKSL